MELGIGADDAAAAAAAISSGILNEGDEDNEKDSGDLVANSQHTGSNELPTFQNSSRDNAGLLVSPENAIFETKLHLAFTFYISPWLQKVVFTREPFTDTLELVGGRFLPGRQAMVRFEFSVLDTTPLYANVDNGSLVEKIDVRWRYVPLAK